MLFRSIPVSETPVYIRGRVTTDDYAGNFYKAMCIQQIVDGKQQALRLSVAGLPAGSQPHWRPPGAQQGPTPHPQRAESRPVQPRFTPPWLRSQRVSSRSGHLREHNWEALPYPRQEPTPALRLPGRPTPAALQGRCPLSPVALGEPRPHARFQERLSDLAAAARSNMRTIHTPHRDNPSCL